MTFRDILKKVNGLCISDNLDKEFTGKFQLDSRKVMPNDCFIAVNSGHDFINEAILNGAQLIICNNDFNSLEVVVIKVDDTKKILLSLGELIRNKYLEIPVIAVTGSVGKTTTKELIYRILSSKYKVLKNEGNKNNKIGLSETLFQLSSDYDICVVEMGMNHLGEISDLSKCAKPNIGIITNIGTSHIGYLGSKKNIYKAKKEILDGVDNGVILINGDDNYLKRLKYKQIIKVGLDKHNDLIAFNIVTTKHYLYFNFNYNNRRYSVKFNIPNEALVNNILLAIYIGLQFNIEPEIILEQLSDYSPIQHRNDIIKLSDKTILIDDCYNASYESIKSGLSILKNYNQEKIIVIGDVLELGKYSKSIHKKIGKILRKEDGLIILVGNEVKYAYNKKFILKNDYNDAVEYLKNINLDNKVIYLKGSRKIKLEEIKKYLFEKYKDGFTM